ncbi:hypothetical protein O9993_05560 [Vibrio lentus]|nr:hypothetical protein [Vibrio lentus]
MAAGIVAVQYRVSSVVSVAPWVTGASLAFVTVMVMSLARPPRLCRCRARGGGRSAALS